MAYPPSLIFYAKYDNSINANYVKTGSGVPVDSQKTRIDTNKHIIGSGSLTNNGPYSMYVKYSTGAQLANQGTVSFWALRDGGSEAKVMGVRVYPQSSPFSNHFYFRMLGNEIQLQIHDANGALSDYFSYVLNPSESTWYHLVANFDVVADNVNIYINDNLVLNSSFTNVGNRTGTSAFLMALGSPIGSSGPNIDDVQMYNDVRIPGGELFQSVANLNFGYPFAGGLTRGFGR